MYQKIYTLKNIIGILLLVLFFSSCFSKKSISSFDFAKNNSNYKNEDTAKSYLIRPNDNIQITISNVDELTKNNINTVNGNGIYHVPQNGLIVFPQFGQLILKGKTSNQIKEELTNFFIQNKLAKEPIFNIRVTNFHVTVLGEINKPGILVIENERITLPEVLALSGDLTSFSNRKNILIIREINGEKKYLRFDMNDKKIMESDYYYLQNNDILYVEPNRTKAFTSSQSRTILGFVTGLISLYIIINSLR
jgi:polysaccharide export outer membrane protein